MIKKLNAIILFALLLIISGVIIQQTMNNKPKITIISTSECVLFMQDRGVTVLEDDIIVCDIVIPKEFGDVYKQYAKAQEKQGFKLSRFKGKPAVLYKFFDSETGTPYSVTTYKGEVIAVD